MLSRKLDYLMALAKEQHFARAAVACQVSQPTLSAAIQQLETELGVAIVRRGQRFQGLTKEGQLVLEAAQRMANERDRLRKQLRDQRDQLNGTLRIGLLYSTTPLLRILTTPFRQRFPRVSLDIMMQSPFDLQQAIEGSAVDVVITFHDDRLRCCRTEILYKEGYELLMRKGAYFSGRNAVSWDELRQLPLCLLSPGSPIFGTWESERLRQVLEEAPHISTNAVWIVMDHVRTGQWASVLPKPVRIMVAGDHELETIPLPGSGKPNYVVIGIAGRKPVSSFASAFFDVATSAGVRKELEAHLGSVDVKKSRSRLRTA
jgi:DNA-binding transcriptional LysR family regulator